MHVKRQLFICIISDTFPSRFCPKSAIFGGWGHLNGLISVTVHVHLNAVSDLNSQDAGLSKTGHICWAAISGSGVLAISIPTQKSKFRGVAASAPRARDSETESSPEVRPHLPSPSVG